MAATERITMTVRELDRFKVIQAVAETGLAPNRAADVMRRAPKRAAMCHSSPNGSSILCAGCVNHRGPVSVT